MIATIIMAFICLPISPAHADISLAKADRDVSKSVLNARLAMRDIAKCNLYQLGRVDGLLAKEQNNLMRYQGWVFSKLQEMGEQLHNIMSDMENLMQQPSGNDRVALETMKSTLSAAGLVPGFGAIAYGASLTVQLGETYAQWHNSSQAAGIAEGIKESARQQVEAFQAAVDIYNDIVAGLAEIAGYRARIQQLMDTYEERCLKKKPGAEDSTHNFIPSPAGTSPSAIETAVHVAISDLDDCDLPKLIALNKFLTAQINNLFEQQKQVFEDLLKKSFELNDALSQLEKGLPQPPNLGWEAVKAGIGAAGLPGGAAGGASFAGSLGSQVADMQLSLDSLQASEALKGPVRQKMRELQELISKHEQIMSVLKRIREQQARILKLIETWEVRCTKQKADENIGYIPSPTGTGLLIATDGTKWCTYSYGSPTAVPVTPIGGGTYIPANPPGSAPPGVPTAPPGTPTTGTGISTPTSTPTPVTGSSPNSGGTPTGSGSGSAPVSGPTTTATGIPPVVVIPLGPTSTAKPPTEGEPPNETETPQPPTILIIKAKESVINGGTTTQTAAVGQQMKLFADSTVAQALPGTPGAKKNDADHNQEPLQCTTGKDGQCQILIPTGTFIGAAPNFEANVNVSQQTSINAKVNSPSAIPSGLKPYISDQQIVNGQQYVTLTYPAGMDKPIKFQLASAHGIQNIVINFCRDKQPGPESFLPLYQPQNGVSGQRIQLSEAWQ